jgi:hypothetical protein
MTKENVLDNSISDNRDKDMKGLEKEAKLLKT